MSMSIIRKISTEACHDCGVPSTKLIDGVAYCAHCGDNILLRTIKKCIEGIEEATVTLKVMPKGVLDAKEKSSN